MRTLILLAIVIANLTVVHSYSNLTVDVDSNQQTGLKPYNVLVQFFIEKIVQPRKVSQFFDRAGIKSKTDFDNYWKTSKWQTMVKDLSYVYIGFGIIGILGVLTVVLIIFLGAITCCCRCCCTSKKDTEPGRRDSCKRVTCGTILLILCLSIGAIGCIGIFSSNYISQQIRYENMLTDINSAFKVVNPFISMARRELSSDVKDVIVNSGNQVKIKLTQFPDNSFNRFDESLAIESNLAKIEKACSESIDLANGFNGMQTGKSDYGTIKTSLDNTLSTEQTNLNNLLTDSQCSVPKCTELLNQVPNIATAADFSNLPDTTNAASSATTIGTFAPIFSPALARYTRVKDDIESAGRVDLDKATNEVTRIVDTTVNTFNSLDSNMGSIKVSDPLIGSNVKDVTSKVSKIVGNALIGIFSMLLLIGFLFVLGIFCGGALPLPKTQGGGCCNSRHGGRLLMAGVAFFFIFGWLFYLLVTTFFLTGGVVQANICRHLRNEDSDLDRIWNIAKGSINVEIIQNSSLKMTDLLQSTKNSVPFYTAFQLENIKGLNITDALNLDKYDIKALMEQISNIAVNVNMQLFPGPAQGPLDTAATDFDNVKLQDWLGECQKPVTKVNLEDFALELQNLAVMVSEPLRGQLNTQASQLTTIQNGPLVSSAKTTKNTILSETNQVASIIGFGSFKVVVDNLRTGNDRLASDGVNEIKFALGNETLVIYKMIEDSAQQVIINVKDKIAPTKPMYLMYESLRHVSCERVLLSFNAMWFSMGWVLFFLQISVILALSLSKLYRKEIPTNSVEPLREEKIPIYTSTEPQPRVAFTYKSKVYPGRDPI